ncbi:Protein SUPPRESSOR OF GENE SILENCING 3-like protein [Bienertia sinuspersici]
MAAVSTRAELKHDHVPGRRKTGWLLESIRNYAVDFSANFSRKGDKGLLRLHRTVQEELKDRASEKECNDQGKQKLNAKSRSEMAITEMDRMQEDTNVMNLKNEMSAKQSDLISSNKFPPERVFNLDV